MQSREPPGVLPGQCDFCAGRKGRNAKIVHELKFESEHELKTHLAEVYAASNEAARTHAIAGVLTFYNFAVKVYGLKARQDYVPLWLTYLEENGVPVTGRERAIENFRARHRREGQISFDADGRES